MTNPFGGMHDRVAPQFLTPMTPLVRPIVIVVQLGEIRVERLQEDLLDVFQEMFLVVLDGQSIVSTLIDNLLRDGRPPIGRLRRQ